MQHEPVDLSQAQLQGIIQQVALHFDDGSIQCLID